MTADEARAAVLGALSEVAPEADADGLRPDVPLRDQVELDSMDFLAFVVGLHERTGIDVPERDYPRLETPGSCVAYLVARASGD